MKKSLVKQKVDLIANCIFSHNQYSQNEPFGLFDGSCGQLLFLLYYSNFSKNKRHILLVESFAERILQQFITSVNSHTFCSGLSGILYLFDFLLENDCIDIDVSYAQPMLDNYLADKMRQNIQQNYYDFMHGALGVGLYFLKKKTNPEYIWEIINFLYQTAEKDVDKQTYKWKSFVLVNKKNCAAYNLAMSHGIISIIIFLTRVVKSGIHSEKIVNMIVYTINYILSQEKDYLKFGSYFPSFILINSQECVLKSRLAWCYGDLGIGLALWQAGNVLEKTEWEEKGLNILIQSTKRKILSDTFILDAGICHGSAGITMIYRRMYLETGIKEFKEAQEYWKNQTLNFSQFKDGLVGYKTFEKDKWNSNDYSLITGISGIGLVLLSCLDNNKQDWDEIFLLS